MRTQHGFTLGAVLAPAALYLFAAACGTAPPATQTGTADTNTTGTGAVVFEQVSVIPMDSERVLPNRMVVVRDGLIAEIDAAGMPAPAGATRIDGRGKFLMPPLAEMHAHLLPEDVAPYVGGRFATPEQAIERVLLMFVLNGVGTVRNAHGYLPHIALRERVARGELIGPTIITSGPSFRNEHVESVAAAERFVADHAAQGYDFIKVYPTIAGGVEDEAVWEAMTRAANAAGIPFGGHVPTGLGLHRVLAAGMRTIDHIDGYLEAAARPGAPEPQIFATNLAGHVDESRFPALAAETRAAGAWIVPTQSLLEVQRGPDMPEEMAAWPGMEYVAPEVLERWTDAKHRIMGAQSLETRQEYITLRRRLLKALHDGGVRFIQGSDSPQTWTPPGFAAHRELASLVASGLTPYQALETGTRNVAVFLDAEDRTGTVEVGKRADLLLVDANPLEDVANAQRITGVMLNGRWLPREEIEALLN